VTVTRRRLLVFGSYDTSLHPRVAVLRDGLAAHGWQVEELNAPLGAATRDKVAAARSPGAAAGLAARQAVAWRGLVAGARARTGADPDVVLVGYMGHADVHLARALFPRSTIVLDHLVGLADTVADRQLGTTATMGVLAAADRAALRAADVIVVDTEQQEATLPAQVRQRAVVVPVGAGQEWIAAGERAAAGRAHRAAGSPQPMRVVFFGLYTPLQGAQVIGRALAQLADAPIEVTMVGTGQDLEATRAAAGRAGNVRWIDWVPGGDLPDLVASHDVCLGIFGTGPKAQRVVPTKVYQGMAAGCAVVTCASPAVAPLADAVLTVPPGDPDALAALLRDLAADKESLDMARRRARQAAGSYSPVPATADLDARLQGVPAPVALPPLTFNAWLRWDVLASELAGIEARDVLEIGPGEGAAACRLARGRAYTGIELSARTRAITEQRLVAQGTPGRLLGSLAELGGDEEFDLVCAFEVIEHIEDDRAALAQWAARVRPGGTLVLSTPAGPGRMGPHDVIAGHFRRYSADGLADLARGAGLVDVRIQHVGYPFGYALEAVRNAVAARRLAARPADPVSGDDVAHLTEASSSIMQPPAWSGTATRLATAPGRWVQRRFPERGTGLVLVARAPHAPAAGPTG
jgi:2-polyprenyl-3-methyl-5-hydroxy-6-metoxy-1,4-benzoquinol methylase